MNLKSDHLVSLKKPKRSLTANLLKITEEKPEQSFSLKLDKRENLKSQYSEYMETKSSDKSMDKYKVNELKREISIDSDGYETPEYDSCDSYTSMESEGDNLEQM